MTIFYFTSTGNCLFAAKEIGGKGATLISIPQVDVSPAPEYADDVIGFVFPIYGFALPKMCRNFISKAKLKGDYIFAVGTYGNLPGACMQDFQRYAAKYNIRIDYAASLLMVDNYLPAFDIKDQIAKLPEKDIETNLARIIADIEARKKHIEVVAPHWRLASKIVKTGAKFVMKDTQAQSYIVNEKCNKCGICAKICPSGNIIVTDKVAFGVNCQWCLGCVHLCPSNAIHLKNQRSAYRWRNPNVTIAEIINANNQTG